MTNSNNDSKPCSQDIWWWAMLVIAVLAVPAVGVLVAVVSGAKGFLGLSIFIVACWISTYLGMRLMHHNPKKP
jgi:hypothetical protein